MGGLLWRRVFTTSRGWTARVEIVPAERPAMVSTSAGERRAWFSVIRGEIVERLMVTCFCVGGKEERRSLEIFLEVVSSVLREYRGVHQRIKIYATMMSDILYKGGFQYSVECFDLVAS